MTNSENRLITTIKEFWDRLTNKVDSIQVDAFHSAYVIKEEDVEDIIKEMVELRNKSN